MRENSMELLALGEYGDTKVDAFVHRLITERDQWKKMAEELRETGMCYSCETFISEHECDWRDAVRKYEALYASEVHDG